MQGQGWFLLLGEALWTDRLDAGYLFGGLALHAGDRGGLAFGSGDLLVVGGGLR